MNGHLARLAARATRPSGDGLRPRLPALFEQPAGLPASELALTSRPVEDGVTGASQTEAGVPHPRGRAAAGPQPAGAAESPAARVPAPPARALDHDTADLPGEQDSPAPDHRPADPTGRARGDVSPSPPPAAEDASPFSPSPRSPVPEQVVAPLVAEAVSAGIRTPAADRTRHESTDHEPATTRDAVRPGDPTAPLTTAPLPRLQAARSPEPTRRDRRPAATEVTVNIGRIEVVPPQPEPRPPAPQRPRPRARASGAPPLADYLRDRNRR